MEGRLTRRQMMAGMTASGAALLVGAPALANSRFALPRWIRDLSSTPQPDPGNGSQFEWEIYRSASWHNDISVNLAEGLPQFRNNIGSFGMGGAWLKDRTVDNHAIEVDFNAPSNAASTAKVMFRATGQRAPDWPADTESMYKVEVSSGQRRIWVMKRVAHQNVDITSQPWRNHRSTWWRLRIEADGGEIRVWIWNRDQSRPEAPTLSAFDSDFASGSMGLAFWGDHNGEVQYQNLSIVPLEVAEPPVEVNPPEEEPDNPEEPEEPEIPEEDDEPEEEEEQEQEPPPGPVASIQQAIDEAAPGSTVTIPAGIYRETVQVRKSITLRGLPGAEIRGDDQNGQVVREYWVVGNADNVTIEGFTMRYASTPVQHGAITNNGHSNWTIRNCTFSHAHGANVSLRGGRNLQLINCDIGYAGQLGVHGNDSRDVLIQGNKIHDNNTNGNDAFWEAGGMKLAWFPNASRQSPSNIVVEDNEVYGNLGHGLWIDLWAHGVTFRYNNVHHNTCSGIIFEVCTGGKIHDNVVWENGSWINGGPGGSGIYVQAAREVDVYGNVVAWNSSNIVVWNESRASHELSPGPMRHVHVYENDVFTAKYRNWDTWALAWVNWNNPGSNIGDSGADNWGSDNRYWHHSPNDPGWPQFRWEDRGFGWGELSEFNGTPGENRGVYLNDSQKQQVLNALGVPQTPQR